MAEQAYGDTLCFRFATRAIQKPRQDHQLTVPQRHKRMAKRVSKQLATVMILDSTNGRAPERGVGVSGSTAKSAKLHAST